MDSIINVESLRFRYPKQVVDTIRDISFNIDPGEIFGFLGPSGSGKSTTQKLLIRLLKSYSGRLEIMGKEGSQWSHDLYQHIGVGFELPNHFSKLTGLENLNLFATFYAKAGVSSNVLLPMELLELVGLVEAAKQRVAEYSKGMKMRLNFARALLNNPELLFLDEPTAGLDPVTSRSMKNIILGLKRQGKTVFLTTHNMHDADELCDRVAFIVEGELKLVGVPTELKLQHGERSVLVKTHAGVNGEPSKDFEYPLATLGSNSEFIELIQHEQIQSIHSKEATLEEVFIGTTGSRLS